jgi:hypothetical protein
LILLQLTLNSDLNLHFQIFCDDYVVACFLLVVVYTSIHLVKAIGTHDMFDFLVDLHNKEEMQVEVPVVSSSDVLSGAKTENQQTHSSSDIENTGKIPNATSASFTSSTQRNLSILNNIKADTDLTNAEIKSDLVVAIKCNSNENAIESESSKHTKIEQSIQTIRAHAAYLPPSSVASNEVSKPNVGMFPNNLVSMKAGDIKDTGSASTAAVLGKRKVAE